VEGVTLEVRVVLLQFQPGRSIFTVLHRHVAGNTGNAGVLLLRAFENYLYSVRFAFLSHCLELKLARQNYGPGLRFERPGADFSEKTPAGTKTPEQLPRRPVFHACAENFSSQTCKHPALKDAMQIIWSKSTLIFYYFQILWNIFSIL
jgi:hypothetical protein